MDPSIIRGPMSNRRHHTAPIRIGAGKTARRAAFRRFALASRDTVLCHLTLILANYKLM
jgi:hypothetical protein